MKMRATYLLLTTLISLNLYGAQALSESAQSTAFGSFYATDNDHYNAGDSLNFPETSSIRNLSHPNDTDFVVLQSGFYYIIFGVTSTQERKESSDTVLTLHVNGTEVIGSRLYTDTCDVLTSIGVIVLLEVGQIITVVNDASDIGGIDTGYNVDILPPSVAAYIDFFRLAPLKVI